MGLLIRTPDRTCSYFVQPLVWSCQSRSASAAIDWHPAEFNVQVTVIQPSNPVDNQQSRFVLCMARHFTYRPPAETSDRWGLSSVSGSPGCSVESSLLVVPTGVARVQPTGRPWDPDNGCFPSALRAGQPSRWHRSCCNSCGHGKLSPERATVATKHVRRSACNQRDRDPAAVEKPRDAAYYLD